eukprot:scaffold11406_cov19-Tisochrysis_lutea.AAC.1
MWFQQAKATTKWQHAWLSLVLVHERTHSKLPGWTGLLRSTCPLVIIYPDSTCPGSVTMHSCHAYWIRPGLSLTFDIEIQRLGQLQQK